MLGSSRSWSTISSVRTVPAGIFDLSDRVIGSAGDAAVDPGLEIRALAGPVGHDPLDPDAADRAAILLADDELLGDVDQSTGQVARVGRAQGGVGQSLAGAVGRDEVLEHREALTERGLDRPGDHLAPGVGHQALHAGDLADLLAVPPGSGVDHHVDRVEGDVGHRLLHGLPDLGVGRRPDLDLLLAPFVVGDDAPLELGLRLLRLLLVAVEDGPLVRGRHHVADGDGQTRLGPVTEAEVLDPVEAGRHFALVKLAATSSTMVPMAVFRLPTMSLM